MSLKAFHLFFVALTVILSTSVGAWALVNQLEVGFCILCFVSALVAAMYGFSFFLKIRKSSL